MAVTDLDRLTLPPEPRLLGLDLGEKTIGLALSDRLLTVATPMETLKRGKFAADAARLDIIISEQGVGGLVVGLPLNMDGSDGPSAQSARAFGRNWVNRSPLPLVFWDERLSTRPSPAPCWMPMPRANGGAKWWTRWPPPTSCRARWTGCAI